jgi:sulfite exporter TauE/SafE
MINILSSLFLTGIAMGSGPCLLSCGPILLSYIAGTKNSAFKGFKCWFIFSVGRLLSTIFLGFLAGLAGTALFKRFYWETSGFILWGITGLFIIFLGFMVFIGMHTKLKLCNLLGSAEVQRERNSAMMLGILIGLLPCIPLIGVLSYISMVSTHYSHGIFMSAAFGLGVIISPLVFASMIAGAIPGLKVLQDSSRVIIFQKICGIILALFGFHILVKTLMEFLTIR